MDQPKWSRLEAAMQRRELGALVAFSKENVAYGVSYVVPSQAYGIRNRQFAFIADRDGNASFLLSSNELREAEKRSAVEDLRPYDEFADDPMTALADLLIERGVAGERIGIELDALPADRWEALKRRLPKADWIAAAPVLDEARSVKTPAELELLRRAAHVAELAQAEAHEKAREGMTEQDVGRFIVDAALKHGADTVLPVQVAAGERSSYSNPAAGPNPLRHGDVVKIDVSLSVSGYYSDTGRAIVVGEASSGQREIWARMHETLATVHEALRPGEPASRVWQTFVESGKRFGMPPAIRFLGHGLGLALHEEPFIAAHSEDVLQAGMVLSVEPIYQDGDIGYHLEDTVVITDNGVENLTSRFSRDLVVVR